MAKLEESQDILNRFGMPPAQQSDAAAYSLLALASLTEDDLWSSAQTPSVRIHDVLQFIKTAYGKAYAENTRETIRKNVMHHFEKARIVDRNPDDPARPTNSGKTCYALTPDAHRVISAYGTRRFLKLARAFSKNHPSLAQTHKAARAHVAVQVNLPDGAIAFLSPGRHNELEAAVLRDFWPEFIPEARLLYLGDTAKKDRLLDMERLELVGMPFSIHDKYPDIVFWDEKRDWLILVEAVTSHGPFSKKRKAEIEAILGERPVHRVYVTAFHSWNDFKRHVRHIDWDTEIWLAEVPDHMIHLNGPKFLAPNSAKDSGAP